MKTFIYWRKRASSQPLKILHNLQIWNSFYWWSKTMNSLKNPVLLMCISSEEKERNEVWNVVATSCFNRIYCCTDVSCFFWLQSLAHMWQKNHHQRLVRKCYYVTVSLWQLLISNNSLLELELIPNRPVFVRLIIGRWGGGEGGGCPCFLSFLLW